ncbi:MAG TPA: DMT family transporter [Allosphingosinicella sp.]|uniref:DMT family transporter n=1 Tax=Allosphingosinicella sp. TaxID=2823234 RepID=UPI002EDB4E23
MERHVQGEVGRALLLALTGFSILSLGDAVVKTMAGEWPGSAVSALRYNFGALGLAVAVGLRHGRKGFVFPRPWLQFGRGAAVSLATICFFLGVMAMPLADATAIQFTSPILTALLSGIVLGERVPKVALMATLLAFAGVLIVLRPNLIELGAEAFYPIGAAFGMAWLIMLNRKSAGDAPVLVMQFLLALMAAPLLLVSAAALVLTGLPQFAVPVPSAEVVLKCAFVALTASSGHLLIYAATVRANAAAVAPMTYVQLLIAALLGWWWFGDAPDLVSLAGAALIIAGGLWLWRAQKRAHAGA